MTLRRNYDEGIVEAIVNRSVVDPSNQEYEILLEFDLKREKEKNMILEERLKNKELFIQQMKHFQEELTTAYEQCKNELIVAQEKIEYLQNVEFREYTEQIADLKHMVMMKNQESKRNSISRDERQAFSSVSNRITKNKSDKALSFKQTLKADSKFSSNLITQREGSPDKFEIAITKEIKKTANFISHFLQMAEFYLEQLKIEDKLTKKLKRSWKWIKEVVKERDYLHDQVKFFESFKSEVAKLYKAQKDINLTILLELIKSGKEGLSR